MRTFQPYQLVLLGSAIIGAFSTLYIYFIGDFKSTIQILLFLVFIILLSALVFYFLIKRYLTERLKVLYRSIRKGKIDGKLQVPANLFTDVIEVVEEDTKRWTEERNKEISKLKAQDEFRREFLGNLAHELKTPVFSIQGYILTLLEGGLEDETVNRNFLERASKATDRMTSILEDLDQLTKLEVNKIELDLVHFDLVDLVNELFEDLRSRAKAKKIKLRFAKEYNTVYVLADRNKIAQVLTNLLLNSIAYGNEKGETQVRFYTMDDIVTIEVSDNGPGIDEEHLPRLFERFYRVEKSRNRNEGGTGLGLAIAKHIIESHGQTISVRSTPDVGSTFTFSLDKGKSSGL